MKKIPKETLANLSSLIAELRDIVETGREFEEAKSDKWREGEKGIAYSAWLDEIESAVDTLDNLPEAPEL